MTALADCNTELHFMLYGGLAMLAAAQPIDMTLLFHRRAMSQCPRERGSSKPNGAVRQKDIDVDQQPSVWPPTPRKPIGRIGRVIA
ncbi:uncharacterized protein FFFS_01311 [Fusarium fujikuroi]|nr:uncharacterized protein FFFS_01311 [Fusarium fujikuroi]